MTKAKLADPPAEAEGLDARTDAARQRVAALRAERAAAALSGAIFDHGALRDAEDDLAALGDAAGEQVRRARTAAAEAEAGRAIRLRGEIAGLEDQRRQAIEEAEAMARAMVDALLRADTTRAEIAARLNQVGGRQSISRNEQAIRLSRCLSAVLTRLSGFGGGGAWGDLALSPGYVRATTAWLEGQETVAQATSGDGQ